MERLPEIRSKLTRYRTVSSIIFILVHALVFVNGYVLLVVLKQSVFNFFVIHASMIAAAGLNLIFGQDLYLRYLRRKAKKLDPILINRAA